MATSEKSGDDRTFVDDEHMSPSPTVCGEGAFSTGDIVSILGGPLLETFITSHKALRYPQGIAFPEANTSPGVESTAPYI